MNTCARAISRFAASVLLTLTAALMWIAEPTSSRATLLTPECDADQCFEEVTVYGSLFDVGGGAIYGGGGGTRYYSEAVVGEEAIAYSDQSRTEPACLEEQIVMQDVQNLTASAPVQSGLEDPPGKVIMYSSQLGDPLFTSDPAWNKWQVVAKWSRANGTTKYTVVIHYMFNDRTRQSTQFKFKNTPYQGCGVV